MSFKVSALGFRMIFTTIFQHQTVDLSFGVGKFLSQNLCNLFDPDTLLLQPLNLLSKRLIYIRIVVSSSV